jgi:DNA-binding SARP family transcriptional activator/TolB-like protein
MMLRLKTFGGLSIEGGGVGDRGRVRPRRLALLAIVAAAGPKGVSREQVLAILWPDSEPERARHALSQTLYSLRRDLGVEPIDTTTAQLRLDGTQIGADVADFRVAIAGKEWLAAGELYAGPFIEGFYLSEAPQFERWAEEQRSELAHDATRALERAAHAAEAAGRLEESAEQWLRLSQIDPLSGPFAAGYMETLCKLGQRGVARAHGEAHATLVRRELEAEPDAAVAALLVELHNGGSRVRREVSRAPAALPTPKPPRATPAGLLPAPPARLTSIRTPVRWALGGLLLVLTVSVTFAGWRFVAGRSADTPVLAVGTIRDLVTPDSLQLGGVLSEMLATSLGRLTSLQVIANSRILELVPPDASMTRTDAARRAGATEVLEGELIPLPDQRLRFDLRRVDVESGMVRGGYQIVGTDRMAVFDSVTVLIAADLGVAAPTGSLAEVSTRSPIAYRLYEEGLRAFFQFDSYAAYRLFSAAVREDSTFAMATYYAWRSAAAIGSSEQNALADRAVALASRASDRDRLLILTHVGATRSDMRALAAGDSLARLFPNDPEALVRAGDATPDLSRALGFLDRSIALDSASGVAPSAACRMCDALSALAQRYDWADSSEAVERTLARWSRLRPADHTPWRMRAEYLIGIGRHTDAEDALRRASSLGATSLMSEETRLAWALRSDDLDAADDICRAQLAVDAGMFLRYRWLCTIALRMQGRYRDALQLVRAGRAPGSASAYTGLPADPYNDAILDLEMGRPRLAASQLLRMAAEAAADTQRPDGLTAREVAWRLTLAATAYSAAGDTIRVRSLIDSVETIGQRSLFGRDPLLHYFLRGLLLARGQEHEAAVRAFRAATHSPSQGYTQINAHLARSLLALGRPSEAVPVMRAALRGGIEGSGLYLTRTEAHELLAQAYDAAGQRDSAEAQFAIVARSWRNADSLLHARRDAAQRRVSGTTVSRP